MNKHEGRWFIGIDWASEKHDVCALDADGELLGERTVAHSGTGLAELCDWLAELSAGQVSAVHVSIEVPHGAVVETLLERQFAVYAINPKQLDRFRDRFTVAGAKVVTATARALRSVADRLLSVACAMLDKRELFDPGRGRPAPQG